MNARPDTNDSDSRSPTPLLWWVAAFVVHRAAAMLFGFDGVFFWEEAYRLLIAEAIRGGWNIPLYDLQADPYAGGSLVFSALAAGVTSVFGSSLLALKSVVLGWSAFGLWLWLLVTDRIAGRRAAHLLGFFWLAAPPIFVVFNVLALGSHSDTVTLTGLQLLLMYRYLEDPARSSARLFAWMAAAGIGLWFSYASAIPLAACGIYALAIGALPLGTWPVAAAGFLAGFSPWILRSIVAGGAFDVVARTFAGDDAARGYLVRLYDLATRGVPVALYFSDIGIPGDVKVSRTVLAYSWLTVFAAAWTSVAIGIAKTIAARGRGLRAALALCPEIPIIAVFPLFLLAIAASNQEFNDYGVARFITFRILVPALPSAFFATALAASRAPATVRGVMLALCGLVATIGTAQLFVGSSTLEDREARARLVGAEVMGHLVVFKHATDAGIARERIEALPAELREAAWRGIGESYAYLYANARRTEPAEELTKALLALDPASRIEALAGARIAIENGPEQVAPIAASPRRDALRDAIGAAATNR